MYHDIAAFSIKSQPFRSITTHFVRKTSLFPDESSVSPTLSGKQAISRMKLQFSHF